MAIHPTAIIDPSARLSPDVTIGAYAVIEGPVALGEGCVIEPHAHLIGPLTAGPGNHFGRGCVIGGAPQHLAADGVGADVVIGSKNTFREYVTINRGSGPGKITRVGDGNYLMTGSHVGHDAIVGNRCILANNALLAGHVVVGDNVFISGNAAVHQFCRIGRLAMLGGVSAATQDMLPFMLHQGHNQVYGANVVGMRRAGMSPFEISAVRQAFRFIAMSGDLIPVALERCARELSNSSAVREIIDFATATKRGIVADIGRTERRAA
jgi:UDP-N-acetylglucosamine acyltransferase